MNKRGLTLIELLIIITIIGILVALAIPSVNLIVNPKPAPVKDSSRQSTTVDNNTGSVSSAHDCSGETIDIKFGNDQGSLRICLIKLDGREYIAIYNYGICPK